MRSASFAALSVAALSLVAAGADGPAPVPAIDVSARQVGVVPAAASAEFPPLDVILLRKQAEGRQAKAASAQLVQAPEAPETLELLLRQERLDDALGVLRAIVTRHPERLRSACEVLRRQSLPFQLDRVDRYRGTLLELTAAARARVTELPTEAAAATVRALMSVENQVSRGPTRMAPKSRRSVVSTR
jgi:hypothetical protein